nr:uncharacterized protein K02A2.6-like [Lytechinus pictus]
MVDTGSSVSIVPLSFYKKHFVMEALQPSKVKLRAYSRGNIPVAGVIHTKAKVGTRSTDATIYVVYKGSALLGLDLIEDLDLTIKGGSAYVDSVDDVAPSTTPAEASSACTSVEKEFQELFSPGLGFAKNYQHRIKVKPDYPPVQQKLRRLPLAVKDRVSQELKRLEEAGVIEKIDASEWVSPIVVSTKTSGEIRLCVDLREVNKAIVVDRFPLPDIAELFCELEGSSVFSKLDLASAYHQLELAEESRDLTAFITHDGLFRYKRVCFGLASAPSTFQKMMTSILAGLPGVQCYLDDVIVYGKDKTEHDKRLTDVLTRMQNFGIRLNNKKCKFHLTELSYLGHSVSSEGISPDDDHIAAILKAPAPTDVGALRSALGLTNYYAKFVENYATVVEPLRCLLRKDFPFVWGVEQQNAYDKIKEVIAQKVVLKFFNPNLPTVVTTDASDYGLGAILSQVKNGREIPVAFASRSLTPAERKYSTGEKEALACTWACLKWYTYLWGRHFTLMTDHKALVTLLNARGTGRQPMRIAGWYAKLLHFDYHVEYKMGKDNFVADALSRLPQNQSSVDHVDGENDEEEEVVLSLDVECPISILELQKATKEDPSLVQVRKFVEEGWPAKHTLSQELRPLYVLRDEFSIVDEVVMRDDRIVVPATLQGKLVQFAHSAHQGIVRTKSRLRDDYWFQGMDRVVEEAIKTCSICRENDKSQRTYNAPMQSVPFPDSPWEKICIDITGPFEKAPPDKKYAIVVVDYHSKWPEVACCNTVTSRVVISMLESLFAREGIPTHLVSDNGTQFVSH